MRQTIWPAFFLGAFGIVVTLFITGVIFGIFSLFYPQENTLRTGWENLGVVFKDKLKTAPTVPYSKTVTETTSPSNGEPDFSPYIQKLQKQIKSNWSPPSDDQDKRVVATFTLNKQGELLNLKLTQPSENERANQAALEAVESTAPFDPLPEKYTPQTIDVQFVFDYTVK